jgi:hypothetical protein
LSPFYYIGDVEHGQDQHIKLATNNFDRF